MILRSVGQHLSTAIARIRAARGDDQAPSIPADALQPALVSLPDPGRSVYLLHARDRLPLAEVARRLDLGPSEVERQLAAALVHLDRQIGTISPVAEVAPSSCDR